MIKRIIRKVTELLNMNQLWLPIDSIYTDEFDMIHSSTETKNPSPGNEG